MRPVLRYMVTIVATAVLTTAIAFAIFGLPSSASAQPAAGSAQAGSATGSTQPGTPPVAPEQAGSATATGTTQTTVTPPPVQPPVPGTAPDKATNTAGGAPGAGAPAVAPGGAGSAAPAASTVQWYDELANRPIQDDEGGNLWMPRAVNVEADTSDKMFYAVYGLSLFFFFAIAIAVVYFVIKYRHRPGHKAEPSAAHNDALEITWTVIPTIICVFLFYYGWRTYVNVVTPPNKAVEVNVTAWKWSWEFKHQNGVTDVDLHVPVDTPVRLVMTSRDVLHAFYAPVMRVKQDIIPRRYTYSWFKATKPGTYRLTCAEYCGTDHSQMGKGPRPGLKPNETRRTVVVVHKPGDYERYLADKQALEGGGDPVEHGKRLYAAKGCVTCHTIDGSPRIGPTFKGTFGSTQQTSAGPVVVDEDYIRESLLTPGAKVRVGFNNQMTSFEGQLKEKDIEGLIAFIKSLK